MNKYQAAIVEYEHRRMMIKQLTDEISNTSGWYDESGASGLNCTNIISTMNPTTAVTCIERYWQANKEARYESECAEETVTPEKIDLCPSCKEVDRLVKERKEARRKYGIAKRRISALGRALIAHEPLCTKHYWCMCNV